MCGARLMYYWQPDRVQALGGARFIGLTGTSHLIGGNTSIDAQRDPAEVEASLDHLAGASMLVSRAFLQEVGLMDEDYFLYYEESDWAMRARGRFRLGYADDAVVYHKEGASIGSNHRREQRSRLADYFLVKSRLRFTRKFRPWALPGVVAYSALSAIKALASGHVGHGRAMLLAIIGISPESALGWRRD
jgi:GT2 family glycosyltransferase